MVKDTEKIISLTSEVEALKVCVLLVPTPYLFLFFAWIHIKWRMLVCSCIFILSIAFCLLAWCHSGKSGTTSHMHLRKPWLCWRQPCCCMSHLQMSPSLEIIWTRRNQHLWPYHSNNSLGHWSKSWFFLASLFRSFWLWIIETWLK